MFTTELFLIFFLSFFWPEVNTFFDPYVVFFDRKFDPYSFFLTESYTFFDPYVVFFDRKFDPYVVGIPLTSPCMPSLFRSVFYTF